MRGWVFPVLLAVLALPSVVGMVEASFAVLDGQTEDWASVAVDLCQGVFTVAIALFLLHLGRRPTTRPIWLLDRRVLARIGRASDRA